MGWIGRAVALTIPGQRQDLHFRLIRGRLKMRATAPSEYTASLVSSSNSLHRAFRVCVLGNWLPEENRGFLALPSAFPQYPQTIIRSCCCPSCAHRVLNCLFLRQCQWTISAVDFKPVNFIYLNACFHSAPTNNELLDYGKNQNCI